MIFKEIHKKALAKGLNRADLKRIKLSIQLALLAIVASLFVIILDLIQSKIYNIFNDIVSLFIFSLPLLLFKYGRFALGKSMVFIGGNYLLLFNASREGVMAGNQFLFLPIFIGPLLIFNKNEKGYALIIWMLSLISFIFLESTDYSFFLYENQDPKLLYVNYLFCFFLSLLFLSGFVLSYNKIYNDSELKLERLNTKLASKISDLKKANTELDSFVYKASHDLRSPLTSLMGLIELMKQEKNEATLEYYLSLEEKIVNRLDNYIVDILNISRNSRLPVKHEIIDFRDLYDTAFNQLSFHENASKIRSEVIVTGEELVSDKMRIMILMNNLLSNSIRYFDATKNEQWIKLHVHTTEESTTIRLKDNGIGIPSAHIEKVFNMFYRATSTNSGSGLGLYIVKETVNKLKGEVSVASEFGQWTEFVITIPNYHN